MRFRRRPLPPAPHEGDTVRAVINAVAPGSCYHDGGEQQ